jgi:hypothetical protein
MEEIVWLLRQCSASWQHEDPATAQISETTERTPSSNLLEKLAVVRLVNKFPAFFRNKNIHSKILSFRTISIVLVLKNKPREKRRFFRILDLFPSSGAGKSYSVQ